MFFFSFWSNYLIWHYTTALIGYIRIWRNLWWFLVQKFSLPELLQSLFAPYKRIIETPAHDFGIENWVGTIVIDLLSRLLGLLIRLVIIIVGVLTLILYTILSLLLYGLWISAPIIITSSIIGGAYFWFQ